MDSYKEREKKIVQVGIIGIISNMLLVVGKILVGLIASSISIVADGLNNLSDSISSIITVIGTKLSNKKPSRKYPYGYGRIEYITSLTISAIIVITGALAIFESVRTFITKPEVSYSVYTVVVVSIAIVIKILQWLLYKTQGNKYSSESLKASSLDSLMDAFISLSTLVVAIICLVYKDAHNWNLEAILGIIIGLFIVRTGITVLTNSVSLLIGKSTDKEIVAKIKRIIKSNEKVLGVYDIILNSYGPTKTIGTAHIEVDDNLTAKEIHRISREITRNCYAELGVIITLGIYASNVSNPTGKAIKDTIEEFIKNNIEIVQYHGFYFDEDKKNINFDIIFEFDTINPDEIKGNLVTLLKDKYPEYNFEIFVDSNFIE